MSCVVFIQPFLELTALCNYLELTTMSMCDLEFLDKLCKSGTCIHIPGFPPMKTDDLPESSLLTALNGARFVYFDRRLHETALVVAHEEVKENIPILMDAGRLREGLDDLVKLADYVVCAARFLQAPICAKFAPEKMLCFAATVVSNLALKQLPSAEFLEQEAVFLTAQIHAWHPSCNSILYHH
ncbi:hypothetical protein JHK86_053733 [Glycine max]|nr:hypothetical protein JHK86_053733 [Glycine max]